MRRRLFWLVNDTLRAVSAGRIDLDDYLKVRRELVERLRTSGPGYVTVWYEAKR